MNRAKRTGKVGASPNTSTRLSSKIITRSSPYAKYTNGSSKQSPSKRKQEAEKNKLAHDCAYHIMVADQKKLPIRKQEISKHVLKGKAKFNDLKAKIVDILKKAYKFDLLEIPRKKDQYILVNKLTSRYDVSEFNETQLQQRGLLFFILTAIYMGSGYIYEDALWEVLLKFGIDVTAKTPHKTFGDVKKYICQDLVKQMYLNAETLTNVEPPKIKFTWGFRALQELDKSLVLDFACEIYENQREDWIAQYHDLQEDEMQEV